MLGRPWIFGEICGTSVAPENIGAVVLQHLDFVLEYYGERVGIPMFRKHVAWYSTGCKNSAQFRIAVNQITKEQDLKKIIKDFWQVD